MTNSMSLYTQYAQENPSLYSDLWHLDKDGYFYLAGPYTGKTKGHQIINVQIMQVYHHLLTSMGFTIIAMPIMSRQYDHAPATDMLPMEFWLSSCKRVIKRSDALLCLPNSHASKGTQEEKRFCEEHGIKFYQLPELPEPLLWRAILQLDKIQS